MKVEIFNIVIITEVGDEKFKTNICCFTSRELAQQYCVEFNKKHKELPEDEILGKEKIFIEKLTLYDVAQVPPDRHLEVIK